MNKSKNNLKLVLLTSTVIGSNFLSVDANATWALSPKPQLQRIEQFSTDERMDLRARINSFIELNPDFNPSQYQFLADKSGVIYVTENNEEFTDLQDLVSSPSSIEP